jgi:fermentation-respiration switch protein FrsA (DUF1100 family)
MRSRRSTAMTAALFAAAPLLLGGCAESMFFYPDQRAYMTPRGQGVVAIDVEFDGPQGARLHGWWLPAQGRSPLGTVLHLHGNAANISNHLPMVSWLPAAGFNVLTFDYRGYGRSAGRPSLDGVVDDTRAALAYLRRRSDVDAKRLAVIGQSLGGATALRVVAEDDAGIRLLIIDSAFSSYRGVALEAADGGPPAWLAKLLVADLPDERDDPIAAAARLRTAALVIHGDRDSIVGQHHGKALLDAVAGPKQWIGISGGGHIDAFMRPEIRERVRESLTAALR